jgi:hypothetical protein
MALLNSTASHVKGFYQANNFQTPGYGFSWQYSLQTALGTNLILGVIPADTNSATNSGTSSGSNTAANTGNSAANITSSLSPIQNAPASILNFNNILVCLFFVAHLIASVLPPVIAFFLSNKMMGYISTATGFFVPSFTLIFPLLITICLQKTGKLIINKLMYMLAISLEVVFIFFSYTAVVLSIIYLLKDQATV